MEPTDLTIEISKSIRDGVHATNGRIDHLRTELTERVDQLRSELTDRIDRLSDRVERVEKRQVETEVRRATEIVAVVEAIGEVKDAILEDRQLRRTVEDHESRLQAIERRLPT